MPMLFEVADSSLQIVYGAFIICAAIVVGLFATQVVFRLLRTITMRFGRLMEREAALTRAAFGTFLLYVTYRLDEIPYYFSLENLGLETNDIRFWGAMLVMALLLWGSVWVMVGAGWRSRGPRHGDWICWYLVKITAGIVIWSYSEDAVPWLQTVMEWSAAWLIITGAVKLVLVLRGMPRPKVTIERQEVYGTAVVADPDEVVKRMRK